MCFSCGSSGTAQFDRVEVNKKSRWIFYPPFCFARFALLSSLYSAPTSIIKVKRYGASFFPYTFFGGGFSSSLPPLKLYLSFD